MAVTKSLTKAVPFEKDSKVEKWELGYTYENDSKGDATYYMSQLIPVKYNMRVTYDN